MPKFNIVTLGCEKNNVDSEGMSALLTEAGYEQSATPSDSDVLIVNTCAFLQAAVDESVGELRTLADRRSRRADTRVRGLHEPALRGRRAQLGAGRGRSALHAHVA